ncbi:hypothetical protein N9121_03270, partial [Pseudomonadales bacterium]|nr:hypothetical protein [Pseudomonadales bacterium]
VGPGKHIVIYYLRNQQLINLVGVVETATHWPHESWQQKAPWSELKADFEGWHPTVQTLLDAVDHDACYRWALYERPPLNNWSTPRTSLLGDAAHPMLPFLAQGACMGKKTARLYLFPPPFTVMKSTVLKSFAVYYISKR